MVVADRGTLGVVASSADKMDHQQKPEEAAFLLMGEQQEVEGHLVMVTLEFPV